MSGAVMKTLIGIRKDNFDEWVDQSTFTPKFDGLILWEQILGSS